MRARTAGRAGRPSVAGMQTRRRSPQRAGHDDARRAEFSGRHFRPSTFDTSNFRLQTSNFGLGWMTGFGPATSGATACPGVGGFRRNTRNL